MNDEKDLLLVSLKKYLQNKDIKKIRIIAKQFHVSEIYEQIKNWPISDVVFLIRILNSELASDLFSEFSPKKQSKLIRGFTDEEVAKLFEEMFTDEAIDVIEELPAKIIQRILSVTDKSTREKINLILRYDKFTCGFHMNIEYVSVVNDLVIIEARKQIKNQINKDELEIVGNIWVRDKNNKFIGYLKIDTLFSENDNAKINDFIIPVEAVTTSENIQMAQQFMAKYNLSDVPIINKLGQLVGVIEADDILEIYEEIDDSVLEQAAIKHEIRKSYFEMSSFELFKTRVFWIIMLLVLGTVTQIIIMGFEILWVQNGWVSSPSSPSPPIYLIFAGVAISTALASAASISGTAGNTGTQTSSNLIRSLALGEVNRNNYQQAIKKEFGAGIFMGVSASIVTFIRMFLVFLLMSLIDPSVYPPVFQADNFRYYLLISLVASFTFFVTIIIGNMIGAFLPIIADYLHWDGAVISGPVQTTIVDIFTFIFYLSLTTLLLLLIIGVV